MNILLNLFFTVVCIGCSSQEKNSSLGNSTTNEVTVEHELFSYQEELEYSHAYSALNDNWIQRLYFTPNKSGDTLSFFLFCKNNSTNQISEIEGKAVLLKDSKLGSESIVDDVTDELVFVREYLFDYQGAGMAINIERTKKNRAQISSKSLKGNELSHLINLEMTLRRDL
jgi:hypothetical protein